VMLGGLFTLNSRIFRSSYRNDARHNSTGVGRLIAIALVLATMVLIATACSGGDDESSNVPISPRIPITESPTPTNTPLSDLESSPESSNNSPDSTSNTLESENKTTPTPPLTPTPTTDTIAVLFSGYDLEFAEGDFWRFQWEWTDRSCAQGSGCKNTEDAGVFQITLGSSTVSNGVTLFEILTTGNSEYISGNTTHSFSPDWSYIGIDGSRIVVANSASNSSLATLFDAETGDWAASSFFSGRYQPDVLVQAFNGSLTDGHAFADWDDVEHGAWHSVRSADSGGECSLFDGRILCPTEEKFDYSQSEYFRPGIGPFGY